MFECSEKADEIILQCIVEALSQNIPEKKNLLLRDFTAQHKITFQEIPQHYSQFIDFLKRTLPKEEYYSTIRLIVRVLHERAHRGQYKGTYAVEAFTRIIEINIQKIIEHQKLLTKDDSYFSRIEILKKIITEQSKKLKDSERLSAIGQTAGMIGHDIRNPLQSIVGELYLAKIELASLQDSPGKKILQENLEFIEENLHYINKIVADLQDYARPLIPAYDVTDLASLIDNTIASISVPNQIELKVNVYKGIPRIELDSHFLKRILTNLITNAIQAMEKGGKLTIEACKSKKNVIITVSDTGVGIKGKDKPKIFSPMFTTKSRGQGFGLAVAKRLVEIQGGTITFESEEGNGTKFTVSFPLSKETNSYLNQL